MVIFTMLNDSIFLHQLMKLIFSKTPIGRLRLIGIAEGTSFLVLLLIAMPLKYMAGMLAPVKYVGWLHGVLFILYMVALVNVRLQYKWPFGKLIIAFGASLLPLGTFLLDSKLQKEERLLEK